MCQKKAYQILFQAKEDVNTTRPLELIHIDLYRLVKIQRRGGKKYILVVVDDYLRFTWTMVLRSKDEIYDVLMIFAKMIQIKWNFEIVGIRSNNGTELENATMDILYAENRIHHNFSAPITPQKNEVVERKNKIMLIYYGLLKNFWAEVVIDA